MPIVAAAIDAAIEEASGYLGAYDRKKIFGTEGDERNALLLIFVKDIAVWHFINLCNAGTDLQLRQDRYERAVAWLKSVQRSEIKPNLPVMRMPTATESPTPLPESTFSGRTQNDHNIFDYGTNRL